MTLDQLIAQLQEQFTTDGDARVDSLRLTLYSQGHQTTLAYDRPLQKDGFLDGPVVFSLRALPSTTQRLDR